jgi:hypothetical protein
MVAEAEEDSTAAAVVSTAAEAEVSTAGQVSIVETGDLATAAPMASDLTAREVTAEPEDLRLAAI